jgi:hypothetical protein
MADGSPNFELIRSPLKQYSLSDYVIKLTGPANANGKGNGE